MQAIGKEADGKLSKDQWYKVLSDAGVINSRFLCFSPLSVSGSPSKCR